MSDITPTEQNIARVGLGAALVILVVGIFMEAWMSSVFAALAVLVLFYAQSPDE